VVATKRNGQKRQRHGATPSKSGISEWHRDSKIGANLATNKRRPLLVEMTTIPESCLIVSRIFPLGLPFTNSKCCTDQFLAISQYASNLAYASTCVPTLQLPHCGGFIARAWMLNVSCDAQQKSQS
jgi:hypothetical protein